MIRGLTAVACCFAVVSLFAQVPPEDAPPPLPAPEVQSDAVQAAEQTLGTHERPQRGVQADVVNDDSFIGTNGSLYLGSPNAALKVFGTGAIGLYTNADASGGAGVERMKIWPDTGNVGIGFSTAPGRKLHVVNTAVGGAFLAQHDRTFTANASASEVANWGAHYTRVNQGVTQSGNAHAVRGVSYLFDKGTLLSAIGVSSEVGVYPAAAPNPNTGTISYAHGLYTAVKKYDGTITNGYGATIAAVDASVNGYGLSISNVTAPNDWGIYQSGADDDNYFAGSVGIGVSSPQQKLHVIGSGSFTNPDAASYVVLRLNSTGTAQGGSIAAMGTNYTAQPNTANDAGTFAVMSYETGGLSLTSANGTNGSIRFYTAGSGPGNERMRITQSGTVGIGTGIAPPDAGSKLHVAGNVLAGGNLTVTGNIAASGSITGATVFHAVYQDVAEWVPATTDMEPGTVVVLNHDRTNEVMPSHGAYDTSVAGVVSAQPGVLLGIGGASKEQIATTGRVKVRVDATLMPIRIGDLLVTSEISGTAMRSEPMEINGRRFHQPGTIIGKALEPLSGGTGEILVLLSLQ